MNQRILPAPHVFQDPPAPTRSPEQSDLTELMLAARRQAVRIGCAGLLGLAMGVLHYATSPREYRATATILIEERQSDLEQEIAAAIPTLRSDASIINQVQILSSLGLATEVAGQLELPANANFQDPPQSLLGRMAGGVKSWIKSLIPAPETPQTAAISDQADTVDPALLRSAARLRHLTSFDRVGRSFVVSISHSSHDPALATQIVNTYADAYLADGIAANVAASERTAEWMEARIEDLRQAALDAAADAERFRAEFGASDQQGLRERQESADALNALLATFSARYQEITLSSSFPSSGGRILSQALIPREPTSPKAWQDLGAGLVLGLLIGLLFAVRREGRETGFRTGADVARTLALPFLGYMPRVSTRLLRRASAAPLTAPGPRVAFQAQPQRHGQPAMPPLMTRHSARPQMAVLEPSTLMSPRDLILPAYAPGSPADHALRRLHAITDGARRGPAGHVLGIGGLQSGDGATALSANLAHTAARAGRATLLIDADFAASGLSRRLGAADASGLVDVLDCVLPAGEAIRRVATTGLDVLPTGLGPRQGSVIEASYIAEFGTLVAELASVYDTIIVDLPPIAQFPEAESLITQIDRVILAVPWGRSPRQAHSSFLQNRPVLSARTLGVVLTETDMRKLAQFGEPAHAGDAINPA